MPTAPPRPCTVCGCLVTDGSGRCPRHQRASATTRGYDYTWAKLAHRWLHEYPWCGQRLGGLFHEEHSVCAREGRQVPADVVDHIRSIRDGGPRLELTNLQSLCASCNRRKG